MLYLVMANKKLDNKKRSNYTEQCSPRGDIDMNTIVTSREDIIKSSKELIQNQGWSAVSIRSVAAACGVSVGSIYNYFASKAELVGAAVESVWFEIFHLPQDKSVFCDTLSTIAWIYQRMEYGCSQYPGFFTLHSFVFMDEDKPDGKKVMLQIWQHIIDNLCNVLRHDVNIRSDAFNSQFTVEKFSELIFTLILSAMLRQDYDVTMIEEMVRRTVY